MMALPIRYNLRNLTVRKLSTALTFTVVSIVVAVLCILLSFAAGIRASLTATGSPLNIVVLKKGATAESTSYIDQEELARLTQTPGVRRDANGQPFISPELCMQTTIPRKAKDAAPANVAVRGVDDVAFDVHTEVRVIEGRRFRQGQMEALVGKQARDRYQNLEVGGEVVAGKTDSRQFEVVGVFEAGGGALESEVWFGRTVLSNAYDRSQVSSATLRVWDEAQAAEAIEYIKGPVVRLNAKGEAEYYRDLSTKTAEIVVLTSILIAIMGVGASFAVANTMYASVDRRRREIAMLRTIGFPRRSIVTSFLLESLLITTAACALGIVLSLFVHGTRQDFFSDTTYTVLAYELRVTPEIVGSALGVGVLVGLIGGLAPALRASRVQIIEALRKA